MHVGCLDNLCRHQFDAISKTVMNMAAPHAGDVARFVDSNSGRTKLGHQGVVFCAAQSGVRFLGRAKILFNSQVNLHAAAFKPAAAASSKFRRLGDLSHSQDFNVKTTCSLFLPRRHGKLHVFDRRKGSDCGTRDTHSIRYFLAGCALGGTSPFWRRYIAAIP